MSELTELPPNPITGKNNVRIVDTYAVEDIIRLYREQENVDVEHYFGYGDTLYLLECPDIGYRFYYPFETAGGAEFYQDLDRVARERGLEYGRSVGEDHEIALKHISPHDSVLEVGCNIGMFLELVAETTKDVVGLDFNPEAIEKAKLRGVTALSESIENHAAHHVCSYDVVCAFQVFEHLAQIGSMLTAMLSALRPGGKLIMSVPNNEPFFQRFSKYDPLNMPPHHAGLWNLAAFDRLANEFGMTLADHEYYGTRGILPDAYLRSKLMADVRSLPVRHSISDKIKMLAFAPIALSLSSFDFLFRGVRNHANLLVVFKK
ncbi:MAG: class I SAM-dependent methyltransferase [Chloracidobacterium sp.]|nr:class I SAM-dependent methyltransferase [Chloracidobacterium sp.]